MQIGTILHCWLQKRSSPICFYKDNADTRALPSLKLHTQEPEASLQSTNCLNVDLGGNASAADLRRILGWIWFQSLISDTHVPTGKKSV